MRMERYSLQKAKRSLEICDHMNIDNEWLIARIEQLEEENNKMLAVLRTIDRWWDASDPSRVVPAIDNPEHGIVRVKNDSMAAGSILRAKWLLKELCSPSETTNKGDK